LQSNWKTKEFKATNGELVTVASIDASAIRLRDGRQLPAAYKQFSSGYVVTANKGQAKTVDAAVVVAQRMPHDKLYVAVTRPRETVTVITSDSIGLQESIGISADRQSAMELAQIADHIAARPAAHRFEHNDHQIYQNFKQRQAQPAQTTKQEMTRNVSIERHRISY
jgi:hypothetical protein